LSTPTRRPQLPEEYIFHEELAWREGTWVAKAEFRGSEVVCRVETVGSSGESRGELMVLGRVREPGILPLVDHGVTAEGHAFVTRPWVQGSDLLEWSKDRTDAEIGAKLAALCCSLESLHRAGLAHADLKPENVLVDEAGEVYLSDFGLSLARGDLRDGLAGTPIYLAPELLLGAAPDPGSDLFALGVILHRLLVGNWPSAREFYGRFPNAPFFEVMRTQPDALPDWARDITAELLARDPDARPASAGAVARHIAGRLGVQVTVPGATGLRFGVRDGRSIWFEQSAEELVRRARSTTSTRPLWVHVHGDDAPSAFRALRLDASLSGVRGAGLELSSLLRGVQNGTDLDHAVEELATRRRSGSLLALLATEASPWSMRMLSAVARDASTRGSLGALLIVAPVPPPTDSDLFDVHAISSLSAEALTSYLASQLAEDDPERHRYFAELLADAAEDSSSRVTRLLAKCAEDGTILFGKEKPSLRSGELPRELLLDDENELCDSEGASPDLLLALEVIGRGAPLTLLGGLLEQDEEQSASELAELRSSGRVRLDRSPVEPLIEARRGIRGAGGHSEADWRRLHARCLEPLYSPHFSAEELALHRWCDDPSALNEAALIRHLEQLVNCGCPEVGVDLLHRILRAAPRVGAEQSARWSVQEALCWVAMGQAERALEVVAKYEDATDAVTQAQLEGVKARVAALKHENDEALERFERAMTLNPRQWVDACVAKIYLLYTLGRDKEVAQQVTNAVEGGREIPSRQQVYLRSMRAMSDFRLGRVEQAHRELESLIVAANEAEDFGREAALSIDLAIVERRGGSLERAAEHLERAVHLYDQSGNISGMAHARATLGGTLRELGRLTSAQETLTKSLETRERLGDDRGAAAVRGMLGLVAADRGRPRAALEELTRAAEALSDAQKRQFAPILLAKAAEMSARIGSEETLPDDALRASDPRVLLSLAREAALRGDREVARNRAESAQIQAMSASQRGAEVEARYLASLFEGTPLPNLEGASPLVRTDAEVLALIQSDGTFDESRAIELAAELEQAGRDDRAARLWISLTVRSADTEQRIVARQMASAALEKCCRGLSTDESRCFKNCLVGLLDPKPEELALFESDGNEAGDDEMEMMTLLEINHRLVEQEDLATLLGVIVESALSVTGAERGFLVLEEHGELRLDTALDSSRGGIDAPEFEFSRSIVGEALAKMEPVRVSNAQDDPMLGSAPSVISLDLRSVMCAPFTIDESTRGALYIDNRVRAGAFNDSGERMLILLADQAALAIQQVRRLEEIKRLNLALKGEFVNVESELKTAQRALVEAGLPRSTAGLIGNSPKMRSVHRLVEKAAESDLPALVIGESGTGKELAARGLHELSPRSGKPFVCENCAALPASLIESELFGYKRGAFTGADQDRPGIFERTAGGTLFLDEIGEIPIDLQAKLLRVLETSTVRRLGDSEPRAVDFRLVTATNRNLEHEVQEGRFRADLYYRIDGLRVEMPDLADRTEDIPALVDHFLRQEGAKSGRVQTISPAVVSRLCRRAWPGNVRELSNEVARLCVLSDDEINDPELVREPGIAPVVEHTGRPRTLADLERDAILDAIARSDGDKGEAAKQLGISRSKIYQRLKEWDGPDGTELHG